MQNHQKTPFGFALVELLVAMLLGLVLMVGVIQVMLSTKETFRLNEDISRTQENGRFALDMLVGDIRMSGYRPLGNGDVPDFFLTDACDTLDPCTANGAGTASDRIGVQYDPDTNVDCFGNAVADTDLIVNVYSITTANNVNSLSCRAWNVSTDSWVSAAQPLIDGVDNMQVLYGVNAGVVSSITQYVSADRVTDWGDVQAVRIALLVSEGLEDGQVELKQRDFALLDSPLLSFTDQHMRRVYSTTVTLNNAFNVGAI